MVFKDNRRAAEAGIKRASKRWLVSASMLVEAQATLLVPVSTGSLKQSIGYQIDEGEMVAYVGTNADYAVYVEFGTGEFAENGQGRKGGWVYQDSSGEWFFTWGQEPQPYIRPAFRENQAKIKAMLIEELAREFG